MLHFDFYEKLTQISEYDTDSDNDDVVVSGDMSEHANDPDSHATITQLKHSRNPEIGAIVHVYNN